MRNRYVVSEHGEAEGRVERRRGRRVRRREETRRTPGSGSIGSWFDGCPVVVVASFKSMVLGGEVDFVSDL